MNDQSKTKENNNLSMTPLGQYVHRFSSGFRFSSLTGRYGSNQDRVEFDDGAEGVLGVCSARQVLAVKLEDETLVLLLQ